MRPVVKPKVLSTRRKVELLRLPALLARTRFKLSRFALPPRFGQSKTASFGHLSTPLDTADNPERMRGKNQSKSSAV